MRRSTGVAILTVGAVVGAVGCGSTSPKLASTASSIPDCGASRTVDDLAVFALGVSARGRVCWQAPLGTSAEDAHSFSSPLLSGGAAFFASDSAVYGVDLTNGRGLWRWDSGDPLRVGGAPGGTYTIAAADGVVVAAQGTVPAPLFVVGLDQRKGARRWRSPQPSGVSSGPIDSGDRSVVFTAYDGRIVEVLDDATGSVRWSARPPPAPPGNGGVEVTQLFATIAGTLLVKSPQGGVDALSAATGQLRWHFSGAVNWEVAVDGLVLITPLPGAAPFTVTTTALDPATGRTVWSVGGVEAPSLWSDAGGALMRIDYGPQSGHLRRVDPKTGRTLWDVTAQAYATADGGNVVADIESTGYQSGAESIVGRDRTTGSVVWRTAITTPNLIDSDLFALDGPTGRVLVIKGFGQISGFSATSGAQLWQLNLPSDTSIDGYAAASGGLVVQVSQTKYGIEGH